MKQLKLLELISLALFLSSIALSSCGIDKGSGDPIPAPPQKMDATRAVAGSIATLGAELYNTNWVGKLCEVVEKETVCSAGGTVRITGSFSCITGGNGVQNLNLDFTYEMDDCTIANSNLIVSLTGTMTHLGSSSNVSSIITSETIVYKSTEPVIISARGANYLDFDDICFFSLVSKLTDPAAKSTLSGQLCDKGI